MQSNENNDGVVKRKRKPHTIDTYLRRLTRCSAQLVEKCRKNFIYESNKVAKSTLLEPDDQGKSFEFLDHQVYFIGQFDNGNILFKINDDYYEGNKYFAQSGFKRFYKDLGTWKNKKYLKSQLMLTRKKLRRVVNHGEQKDQNG